MDYWDLFRLQVPSSVSFIVLVNFQRQQCPALAPKQASWPGGHQFTETRHVESWWHWGTKWPEAVMWASDCAWRKPRKAPQLRRRGRATWCYMSCHVLENVSPIVNKLKVKRLCESKGWTERMELTDRTRNQKAQPTWSWCSFWLFSLFDISCHFCHLFSCSYRLSVSHLLLLSLLLQITVHLPTGAFVCPRDTMHPHAILNHSPTVLTHRLGF